MVLMVVKKKHEQNKKLQTEMLIREMQRFQRERKKGCAQVRVKIRECKKRKPPIIKTQ